MNQQENEITLLKQIRQCRRLIIEMIAEAGTGHPGPSLSVIDIIATLYFRIMDIRPDDPKYPGRDRFILSKGHAAPALYATLIAKGFFPKDEIKGFRKIGGNLQGHTSIKTKGVDFSSGSLGLGLSIACGMALASKYKKTSSNIYCILGDGECNEGQIWESALVAAHYQLDNLYVIVDRNGYQYEGKTEEVMKLEPFTDKWESFGWSVWNIDGHDPFEIENTVVQAEKIAGKPKVIIAHTVKGKGVSFMEGNQAFHAKAPTMEQAKAAIQELTD